MGPSVFYRNIRVISDRAEDVGISTPQEARANTTWMLVESRAKKAKGSGVYWPRDFLIFWSVI